MSTRLSNWFRIIVLKDEGLSILLLLLVIFIFVVYPLQILGITNLLLVRIFLSLLVVAGVWTTTQNKAHRFLIVSSAIVNLFFQWYYTISDAEWVLLASIIITIYFEGLLIIFILLRTTASGPVNSYRIQGSVVVYLLIGMLFSSVYAMIYLLSPDAFIFSNKPPTVELSQASLTYFSFVTLTTIGYGDIQPLHPFSQAVATAEGLIGQLFPAILIARLVSQSIASTPEKTDGIR